MGGAGCKVNRFYIKPQLESAVGFAQRVVKLIDSTSNHNRCTVRVVQLIVVKLIDSTSNHNWLFLGYEADVVVKLIDSTSNHNRCWILAYVSIIY